MDQPTSVSMPTSARIMMENCVPESKFMKINRVGMLSAVRGIDIQAKMAHNFILVLVEILSFTLNKHIRFSAKKRIIPPRIEFLRKHFRTDNAYEEVTWTRLLRYLDLECDENAPIELMNFSLIECFYDRVQKNYNYALPEFIEAMKKNVGLDQMLDCGYYGSKDFLSIDNIIPNLPHIFTYDDNDNFVPE
jgi:hypothetical protein